MKDLHLLALILTGIEQLSTKEILRLVGNMTADKAQLAQDIKEFSAKYDIDMKEAGNG